VFTFCTCCTFSPSAATVEDRKERAFLLASLSLAVTWMRVRVRVRGSIKTKQNRWQVGC
jgi:hypothetical protein